VVAIALATFNTYLGIIYVSKFMPNAELEGILPPLYGGVAGYWGGVVLGCWLGLRLGGYSNGRRTAIYLAWLFPLTILLLWFSTGFLTGKIVRVVGDQLAINLLRSLYIAVLIALPLLARFLVNRNIFKKSKD
jgi:hypothetical protein